MAQATATQRLYEGLFLMAQSSAGVGEQVEKVRAILERAEAEIVTVAKWDDRKLAYPIHGQKRGTYIIALFRVEGGRIANIERDCNLGDDVARVLITSADHLGETELELARQEAQKTADEAAISADARQDDSRAADAGNDNSDDENDE